MLVKDLIKELLNHNLNEEVVIRKELAYNVWVNSDVKVTTAEYAGVILPFDFRTENLEIQRKNSCQNLKIML